MVDKIVYLFENSGKSTRQLLLELKLPTTAITEWKKGKANPSLDAVIKIADYFNESVDYILGRETKETPTPILSEQEKQLLELFKLCGDIERELVLAYIEGLTERKVKA